MPKAIEITRNDITLEELENEYNKESDGRRKQRLLMLIHVKEGKSANETSKMVKTSKNTVSKWVKRFNEEGFDGLDDRQRSGRPAVVDYDDLSDVLDNHKPTDFGYPYQSWFPRLLYQYLIDYQNLENMTFEYIYEVIRRAGYTLKVPRSKHYRQDEEEVRIFKKKC